MNRHPSPIVISKILNTNFSARNVIDSQRDDHTVEKIHVVQYYKDTFTDFLIDISRLLILLAESRIGVTVLLFNLSLSFFFFYLISHRASRGHYRYDVNAGLSWWIRNSTVSKKHCILRNRVSSFSY